MSARPREQASATLALGRDPASGLAWGSRTLAKGLSREVLAPVGIFAAAQALASFILMWASRFQTSTAPLIGGDPRTDLFVYSPQPRDPGYLGLTTNFDGQWYEFIATQGYLAYSIDPSIAAERAWYFPPLYPGLVGTVMKLTGLPFAPAAVAVSLVCGAIAMILMYRLAHPHVGHVGAAGLVGLASCFVTAPLYQVAYTESTALLLVLWALLCIRSEHYIWALVPTVLLAFTRLIAPPLAAVVLVGLWLRRGDGELISRRTWWSALVLAFTAVGSVLLWGWIAERLAGATGESRASHTISAAPFGWFGFWFSASPVLVLLPLTIALVLGLVAWSKRRHWGTEMSVWAASYSVYLLLVTGANTGLLRYMMLAFPYALLFVGNDHQRLRRRLLFIGLVALTMICLQVMWVRNVWVIDFDQDSRPAIMP